MPNHKLHGTKSQHKAYAAGGAHLIWRSPVLSTQHQGLLPSDCIENSTAQALMFRHLPEISVLQRSFSSTRTVPILPTPKKGTDTFPGVQIFLPLFSVLASESDVLLVHSRTNIYRTTKSMDSFKGTEEEEFCDLVAFPAPPLTYWSLWSLIFSSKRSNRGMQVFLQSHNKEWKRKSRTRCSQCSGEGVGGGTVPRASWKNYLSPQGTSLRHTHSAPDARQEWQVGHLLTHSVRK